MKTKNTASLIGVLLGMAGIFNHGIFEILQGNTSTNGFFIDAIGEANRFWIHGTEAAFTVIHNFLITGICVIIVGVAIVIWSLKYIHVKHGTTIFLLLLIVLTLVGGGIGHIILFLPTWAFATRINKSLELSATRVTSFAAKAKPALRCGGLFYPFYGHTNETSRETSFQKNRGGTYQCITRPRKVKQPTCLPTRPR
jgi:hypothetical protein